MPDEGTAEVEGQGNVAAEFDAPPLETEIALDEVDAESASADDSQTETADPFASLDDETLRSNPRVAAAIAAAAEATAKDVRAREQESARQRIESGRAQALAERHAADRQYQASDEFLANFETLVRNAETDIEGRPVLDRAAIKQLNGLNIRTGADIPVSAMANLMAEAVGEGFTQTAAERAAQTAAYSHFHQTLDPQPLFRHWLAVQNRAALEQSKEAIRAEVTAEVRKDEAAKAEAAKAAAAAATRRGAQPTSVSGQPVRTGGPTNDFQAATAKLSTGSLAEQMRELERLTA